MNRIESKNQSLLSATFFEFRMKSSHTTARRRGCMGLHNNGEQNLLKVEKFVDIVSGT